MRKPRVSFLSRVIIYSRVFWTLWARGAKWNVGIFRFWTVLALCLLTDCHQQPHCSDLRYANLHCHNLFVFPPSFTPSTVCIHTKTVLLHCKHTHHFCLFEFSLVLKWESPRLSHRSLYSPFSHWFPSGSICTLESTFSTQFFMYLNIRWNTGQNVKLLIYQQKSEARKEANSLQ